MMPAWLELVPVELPGRGARMGEGLHEDMATLVAQLAREIRPGLPQAYAFFGHSLGALLAFELARTLAADAVPAPRLLCASGAEAPTMRDVSVYAGLRSDDDVLAYVRSLNGMDADVLANQELLALMLPVIRADLRLCASYRAAPLPPLACPLTVFGGWHDHVTSQQLHGWRRETRGDFSAHMFEGDHFFIHSAQAEVVDRLSQLLLAARPQCMAVS